LWGGGRNWLSVRAGYAKSTVNEAGHGGFGYGFGFSRMLEPVKIWRWTLLKHFSLGGYVHYEMLDHYFDAAEIEVPASLELVRHFRWNTPLRPYLGFGAGSFYRKAYRTGADTRSVRNGGYLTFGGNAPIGGPSLLGIDVRVIRVDSGYDPPNPVFGTGSGRQHQTPAGPVFERRPGTHWSAKINYTLVY
jgi:hypothetical protein